MKRSKLLIIVGIILLVILIGASLLIKYIEGNKYDKGEYTGYTLTISSSWKQMYQRKKTCS